MNAADVVRYLLEEAGVGIFNKGMNAPDPNADDWNIAIGSYPSRPGQLLPDPGRPREALSSDEEPTVFCINTGGRTPSTTWLLDMPHVQLLVVGRERDYKGARLKVQECKDALLGIDAQDIPAEFGMRGDASYVAGTPFGAGRLRGIRGVSDIVDLRRSGENFPRFAVNFELELEPDPTSTSSRQAIA